jgi:hypothetical protein
MRTPSPNTPTDYFSEHRISSCSDDQTPSEEATLVSDDHECTFDDDVHQLVDDFEQDLSRTNEVKKKIVSIGMIAGAYTALMMCNTGVFLWSVWRYNADKKEYPALYYYSLLVGMVLTCFFLGKVIVLLLMRIVRNSQELSIKFLYYLQPLASMLSLWIGAGLSLGMFTVTELYQGRTEKSSISDMLTASFVLFSCLTAGNVWVRIFSISFHRSSHHHRIMDCLLVEYSLFSFARDSEVEKFSFADGAGGQVQKEIGIEEHIPMNVKELATRSVSNYRLARVIESFKQKPYLLSQIICLDARLAAWERKVERKVGHNVPKAKEIQALGRYLFKRIHQPGSRHITAKDFERFLPSELAQRAMSNYVSGWNGRISERDFILSILEIMKERLSISLSLWDAQTSLKQLESFVYFVAFALSIVVTGAVFGVNVNLVLGAMSACLISSAVAVGDVLKGWLSSIFFLFVSHPFDIGDRVVVDGRFFLIQKVKLLT